MLKKFIRLVNLWNWNLNRCETLLAVSGGADSVVMAYFFKELNLPFAIAHVNYGLRGADSDADQELVEQLAKELGVDCFVHKSDPKLWSVSQGISLQMAARKIRYDFFDQIRNQFPGRFGKIATAHHGNDNLEHFFIYLLRGNSSVAWRGIPVENGDVIRPLLGYSKQEIYALAQKNGWRWREDISNQKPTYLRNKVRQWVVPALVDWQEELSARDGLEEGTDEVDFVQDFFIISSMNQRLRRDIQADLELRWEEWVEATENSIWIPRDSYVAVHSHRFSSNHQDGEFAQFAKERLLGLGFFSYQVTQILDFSVQVGGKLIGKQFTAWRTRTGWMLLKDTPRISSGSLNIERVPGPAGIEDISGSRNSHHSDTERIDEKEISKTTNTDLFSGRYDESPFVCYVSKEIEGMELLVGQRKKGDYFHLKSGQKKLLSDVFVEAKIENYLKDSFPVVTRAGGEIVAVLGLKIGQKYRVKESDSYCFRLEFIQN